MGQKVHPTGIRLGIVKDHTSVWYAEGADYADKLYADLQVREYIENKLKNASVSRIEIQRPAQSARVTIHTARPGIVIGKKGEDVEKLRQKLNKMMGVPVHINIEEIRKPDLDTVLSAHSDAISDMELHSADSHATSTWERLRWLAVSINHQRATAFVGDRPIFTDLVSTGLASKGLTPLGRYTINRRVYNEVMDSATIGLPWGHPAHYRLENVLYTQYFTNQ